jgi:hypothetical protein
MLLEEARRGLGLLSEEQQEAIRQAGRILAVAELGFVMMLFGDGKQGAVAANIDPANAVRLIETALEAARTTVEAEEREARLQ